MTLASIEALSPIASLSLLPPPAIESVQALANLDLLAGAIEIDAPISLPDIQPVSPESAAQGPFLLINGVEHHDLVGAYTAAVTIAAHRIVRQRNSGFCEYADFGQPGDANSVIGMSLHNAIPNAPLQVQREGPISFSGWSWLPSLPIYLSGNGFMTQAPASGGYLLRVGFAITTTSMHLRIGRPIFRS